MFGEHITLYLNFFIALFGLLNHCNGQGDLDSSCNNSYVLTLNTYTIGGVLLSGITTLDGCKSVCKATVGCLGFDYEANSANNSRCWIHTSFAAGTNASSTINQYRIANGTCRGSTMKPGVRGSEGSKGSGSDGSGESNGSGSDGSGGLEGSGGLGADGSGADGSEGEAGSEVSGSVGPGADGLEGSGRFGAGGSEGTGSVGSGADGSGGDGSGSGSEGSGSEGSEGDGGSEGSGGLEGSGRLEGTGAERSGLQDSEGADGSEDINNLNCDFGNGNLCGWSSVPSYPLSWAVQLANQSEWRSWGKVDHTTGTGSGYYAYLYTNDSHQGSNGGLTSPVLSAGPPAGRCLTFYYNMMQTDGVFKVIMNYDDGDKLKLLQRKGNQGDTWHKVTVSLLSTRPFSVIFEHSRGSLEVEIGMAIDDVAVTNQQCDVSCDFDNGNLCKWDNVPGYPISWATQLARNSPWRSWGKVDHTAGTGLGYYAYLYTNRFNRGSKGALTSPVLSAGPPKGRCLTFYYKMWQTDGAFRVIMKYADGRKQTVLRRDGKQGSIIDTWLKATVTLRSTRPFSVIFEHSRGSLDVETGLAVDDIAVTEEQCHVKDLNCDFSNGTMCGWQSVSSDPLPWAAQLASESPWRSWGKVDHTTGTGLGYYAYLFTNDGSEGSTGGLTSPFLSAGLPTGRCLTFYYSMLQTDGVFKVIMKYDDGRKQTVLQRNGNQGSAWHKATVSLLSVRPFSVIFEHSRGSLIVETGLAINDVAVTNKQCDVNCNFDNGSLCGWSSASSDPLSWAVQLANQSEWRNWGKVDHTTGTGSGYYAYLDTEDGYRGSKGGLTSPVLSAGPPTGRCLTFYYNMMQTDGVFKVIMKYDDGSRQTVLQRNGNQGNAWNKATISLLSMRPFSVILEHSRGSLNVETGLAIDDIAVANRQCDVNCDFDYGTLCGWDSVPSDPVPWEAQLASDSPWRTWGKMDHTTGTGFGNDNP